MTGKIMKGIGGFYYVYVEGSGLYECRAKGVFRNRREKPCVGDWVDIDVISQKDHTGNLVKIHSRKNRLIRPLAANVDQALVIFAVHEPEPDYHLLNRFLIMMERQHIPVVIGFNKMDLAQNDEETFLKKAYEKSGCQLLFLSAAEEKGIEELKEILEGKTTILAGPSGVGKSSTLNRVSREKQMETGNVSEKIKRGKHTTRHVEIFDAEGGGRIFDTPGFTSFEILEAEEDNLMHYYPDLDKYSGGCYYDNCRHLKEPQCAVRDALENGKIHKLRYQSYAANMEEIKNRRKY